MPITELRNQLGGFASRCVAARWMGALFHVGVAQDIVEDDAAVHGKISARAYSAEQADLEAAKILDAALADGKVTPDEIQKLRVARRMIQRSATEDRKISDLARI